jgi:hypothetical protein
MLAAKGVSGAAPKVLPGLIASVQTFLQKHDGGAVVRIGEGAPGHWQTAGYG